MDQSQIRTRREKYCDYKDLLKLKTNIRFGLIVISKVIKVSVLVFSFSAVNTYLLLHYSGSQKPREFSLAETFFKNCLKNKLSDCIYPGIAPLFSCGTRVLTCHVTKHVTVNLSS